ncbi:hypothetical protein D3C72_2548140 [compost metagenome]
MQLRRVAGGAEFGDFLAIYFARLDAAADSGIEVEYADAQLPVAGGMDQVVGAGQAADAGTNDANV